MKAVTIGGVLALGGVLLLRMNNKSIVGHTAPETWKRIYDVTECPYDIKWVGRKISDIPVPEENDRRLVKAIEERKALVSPPKKRLIPYTIIQTNEKAEVPEGMLIATKTILNKNPEYDYLYFTNEKAREYIADNFSKQVLDAYDKVLPGAYKADLFRYCILYKMGGVYIDMGMIMLTNLDDLISDTDSFISPEDNNTGGIYNAFMCCEPGHPIVKEALWSSVENILQGKMEDGPLSITGPILLARAFEKVIKKKVTPGADYGDGIRLITYYRPEECMGGEIIDGNKRILCTRSPSYNSDRKWYNTRPHYSQLWREGMVYTYTPSKNLSDHQKRLKQLLKTFHRLSEEHHFVYWVSDGTLLGMTREGDIIPWDDDIDVHVPKETIKILTSMSSYLNSIGYKVEKRDSIWRFEFLNPEKKGYIDLFEVKKTSEERPRWLYVEDENIKRWPNGWFYDEEIYPLNIDILGEVVTVCPNVKEKYLERMYGKDWKVPKKWANHGTE